MTRKKKETTAETLKKENEWLKPAIIIALLALISSVVFNYVQYRQNERSSARASEAQERADHLQKLKTDWLDEMQRSLARTNREIISVGDQLRLDSLETGSSDPDKRQETLNNFNHDQVDFDVLLKQKQRLRDEIDQYLANDKAP